MEELPKNRHLLVFLEVARCGGIMSAARRLHMTQPSVTRIIKELERYIGAPLFYRSSSGVLLNHAGDLFYSRVLSYTNGLKKSIADIRLVVGRNSQRFSLGYSSLIGYTVLPDIITRLSAEQRGLALSTHEGQLSTLLPLIDAGVVDCAIGTLSDEGVGYEYYAEKIFNSRFSLFSSALNPQVNATRLGDFSSAQWVLPNTRFGYYHELNQFLIDGGIDIASAVQTDSISTILNLVANDSYITILANAMGEGRNTRLGLKKITLTSPPPSADYYLVWSKKFIPSLMFERFKAIIRETCARKMAH